MQRTSGRQPGTKGYAEFAYLFVTLAAGGENAQAGTAGGSRAWKGGIEPGSPKLLYNNHLNSQ
jgi:hypothetical protein